MSKEISKIAVEDLASDLFPAVEFEGMPGDIPTPQKTKEFVAELARNGASLRSIESKLKDAGLRGEDSKYRARKEIMKALESIHGGGEQAKETKKESSEAGMEQRASFESESKKGLFERFFKL